MTLKDLNFGDEVAAAFEAGKPVIALESTVIAHGLPQPQNLETALKLESIIRENGAVPATIAMLDGRFHVGLDHSQLEYLATAKGIRKISRRDIPIASANKLNCATTVATTAYVALRAGIRVFATGGIGGVHRGFSADVSADLVELMRSPIAVVCSGAKVVLDMPATREWLETYGITVLGWQCSEMPAFYSRTSGLPIDQRVDTAAGAAAIILARDNMGLTSSILVTAPVPEEAAISLDEVEEWLRDSLAAAATQNITGKEITPFLLSEMSARSDGRTLTANIALLENNARIAAEIALALG